MSYETRASKHFSLINFVHFFIFFFNGFMKMRFRVAASGGISWLAGKEIVSKFKNQPSWE